jgi:hypothetical protein
MSAMPRKRRWAARMSPVETFPIVASAPSERLSPRSMFSRYKHVINFDEIAKGLGEVRLNDRSDLALLLVRQSILALGIARAA